MFNFHNKSDSDELKVKSSFNKTDEEIATAGLKALRWNYSAPETVNLVVDHGWITLSGETDWEFQRKASEKAISHLHGMIGFTNNITIKPKILNSDIQAQLGRIPAF